MDSSKQFSLGESLKAQKALRDAAGLKEETFPMEAFVGMISDEVETLRKQGMSDEQIVALIQDNSSIELTAEELVANYATPEERLQHSERTQSANE